MDSLGFSFLLVGQDMNKGHRKDPFSFGLSLDVADLWGEAGGIRWRQAHWPGPGGPREPSLSEEGTWGALRAVRASGRGRHAHSLSHLGKRMNKTNKTDTDSEIERRLAAVRGEGWVEKVKGQSKHINKRNTHSTDRSVVMPEGGGRGRQRGGRG